MEAFQAGFGPHAKEIMADIPNYTDLTPVIQISEVLLRDIHRRSISGILESFRASPGHKD